MAVVLFLFIGFWVALFLMSGFKIVHQYERGIRFTLGKYSNMMGPGLNLVIPIFQTWQKVDIRTTVVDVPDQDCMTQENVSVKVNAVLYYKILDVKYFCRIHLRDG